MLREKSAHKMREQVHNGKYSYILITEHSYYQCQRKVS